MKQASRRERTGRGFSAHALCVATVLTLAGVSVASPPLEPIPVPLYSFDAASPSVGAAGVLSDGVLRKESVPYPVTALAGANIGLGAPEDDLDGMSFNRAPDFPPTSTFVLMFSVDRETTGNMPPSPALLAAEAPFNVADQAMRGQAAGDAFVSHNLFTRAGIVPPPFRSFMASNTQVLNNYDEGGHDFEAMPMTSSRDVTTNSLDNVNSMATEPASTSGFRGLRQLPGLYFTVTTDSPSLGTTLPGISGSDIFFDPAPDDPQSVIQLYISGEEIGLGRMPPFDNDIGGLVVFDQNLIGVFDVGDRVLFSLAPGSPALSQIPWMSTNGTADVLMAYVGTDGFLRVQLFAAADELGLTGGGDSVDALEVVACPGDPIVCAQAAGIRLIRGDWTNDGIVDAPDVPYFVGCLSGPREGVHFTLPPMLCQDVFDFDMDGDVDLFDFGQFQRVFMGP